MFKSLFNNIKYYYRVFKCFKEIYPWDFAFLYEVEKFQIGEMIRYFEKASILEYSDYHRILNQLKLAKYCLEVLTEEEDLDYIYTGFNKIDFKNIKVIPLKKVNWKNASRFMNNQELAIMKETDFGVSELYRRKCEALYYKLRKYYMTSWWD